MADKNMEAQISVEFEEATSRQSLNSGETINTLWSKVKRWLSDLKAVAFSGSYIDLSDKPTTATTDNDGLMSASDKGKLDAFEITTTGGKLHDKDIATTDLIPTELPANGGNADTVNGHSVNADVPENAKFTDTVVDINVMEYSVNFSEVSWETSYLGKFESYITLNNVNKIISINLGNWDNFNPDDIVQALIVGTNIFGFMSNTAKSNGHMTFRITYI